MTARVLAPRKLLAPLLRERRRLGRDRHDEVWEGVYHMVPGPTWPHQRLATELLLLLGPIAKSKGLLFALDLDLRRPGQGDRDYRQPDLIFFRMIEGDYPESAELVVEILSPGDESRAKLSFYGALGVKEALLIEPRTRTPELFVNRDGKMTRSKGAQRSEVLGVTFAKVRGPKLRLSWDAGSSQV